MRLSPIILSVVCLSLSLCGFPQTSRPQPHLPRAVPVLMKMLKQSSGESVGSIKVEQIRMYRTTKFTIPVTAGTLSLGFTWSGETELLMSLTGPAGHGLPGRIALATRSGTSPLRVERYISPDEAAKGPLEVELSVAMFVGRQRTHPLTLKDAELMATLTPDEPVPTPAVDMANPTNWAFIRQAMSEARLFSKSEADSLEKRLSDDPDNLLARLSLLAFYSSRGRQLANTRELALQRRRQMLWMIEHEGSSPQIFSLPEAVPVPAGDILFDPEGTLQAKQLWTKQINANPNDIPLLKNAARFLMHSDYEGSKALLLEGRRIRPGDDEWIGLLAELYSSAIQGKSEAPELKTAEIAKRAESELRSTEDPNLLTTVAMELAMPKEVLAADPILKLKMPPKIELAEELANRAISLEPDQPVWAAALVNVLQIERATSQDPKQRLSATRKMYESLKGILERNPNRIYPAGNYSTMSGLAYDLDDIADAKRYSEQALALVASSELESDPSRAEAQHDSNSTLGRLALRNKDIVGAKKALAKAGAASSAGTFDRQGPDMALAQELLGVGERQAVLDYLRDCERLWPTGSPLLQKWRDEIQKGKTPQLNQAH